MPLNRTNLTRSIKNLFNQEATRPLDRETLFKNKENEPFIQNLNSGIRDQIFEEIQSLQKGDLDSSHIQSFQEGDFDASIFLNPDWYSIAFYHYLNGSISESTMEMLSLYHASIELDPELKTYSLFDRNGKENEEAFTLLKTSLNLYLSPEARGKLSLENNLGPSQFFVVDLPKTKFMESLLDLEKRFSLGSPLISKERGLKKMVVVPSNLLYQIHKAKRRENAIKPDPQLGYNQRPKLSDPSKRVLYIPFPLISCPLVHNYNSISHLDLWYHDAGYHHLIESANPHRAMWIDIANRCKAHPRTKECNFQQFIPYILDREFKAYIDLPPEDAFCSTLQKLISSFDLRNKACGENGKEVFEKIVTDYLKEKNQNALGIDENTWTRFQKQLLEFTLIC